MVRGSPFDKLRKLTMRESGAARLVETLQMFITCLAERDSLQSSLSLMVSFLSLSKGEPRTIYVQPSLNCLS
jgi:hypothetical protein